MIKLCKPHMQVPAGTVQTEINCNHLAIGAHQQRNLPEAEQGCTLMGDRS